MNLIDGLIEYRAIKGRVLLIDRDEKLPNEYIKSEGDVEFEVVQRFEDAPVGERFDTILFFCHDQCVLNDSDDTIVIGFSQRLMPNGRAFILLGADILPPGGYFVQGFESQVLSKWSCSSFELLIDLVGERVFEYKRYTDRMRGVAIAGPFLQGEDMRELLVESNLAFAFFDKFPVNNGHSLVVPKRVVANYFDLTEEEQKSCWKLVNCVKRMLESRFEPDGFNVGVNIGPTAGQTIDHCHIHIIPRYQGDVPNPRGGIRGVIPSKKDY